MTYKKYRELIERRRRAGRPRPGPEPELTIDGAIGRDHEEAPYRTPYRRPGPARGTDANASDPDPAPVRED